MEDEVKPKKLPRLRKANFSTLDELILQREIEKNGVNRYTFLSD
jgi:hypothetical protein